MDKEDEDEQEENEEIDGLALAAVHADTEKAKANRATAKKRHRLVDAQKLLADLEQNEAPATKKGNFKSNVAVYSE